MPIQKHHGEIPCFRDNQLGRPSGGQLGSVQDRSLPLAQVLHGLRPLGPDGFREIPLQRCHFPKDNLRQRHHRLRWRNRGQTAARWKVPGHDLPDRMELRGRPTRLIDRLLHPRFSPDETGPPHHP